MARSGVSLQRAGKEESGNALIRNGRAEMRYASLRNRKETEINKNGGFNDEKSR